MRKLGRVCAIILFFTIFQINFAEAKQWENQGLGHVDVYINGQVSIDQQINGVSQEEKKVTVNISDVSVEIEENNKKKTYTNFREQTQSGSKEREFHKDVDPFTKNAKITVRCRISSTELDIDTQFEKVYSGADIDAAIEECPYHIGCDIRITSREIKNVITYDVIFKSDEGGKFENEEQYIEHINIISGEAFPKVPQLTADENYEFAGWYDESTNLKIEEFPKTVTKDLTVVAKWKKVEKENNNKDDDDKNNEDKKEDEDKKDNEDNENKKNDEDKKDDNKNEENGTNEDNTIIETSSEVANDENNNNNIANNDNNIKNLDSYNPPKTAVENNITLLIVSFIISLTVTIGLGYKIKKNRNIEEK